MIRRRVITLTAACLVTALAALATTAEAGSLLSGYGGPGQGSQVILGSSLVKGGGGGGGSHNGGGSTPAGEPAPAGVGTQSSATGAGAGVSKTAARSRIRKLGSVSAGGLHAYRGSSSSAALRTAPGGSDTLGLSGENLLYVVLGLVALIFTGVVTRRIARPAAVSRHGS